MPARTNAHQQRILAAVRLGCHDRHGHVEKVDCFDLHGSCLSDGRFATREEHGPPQRKTACVNRRPLLAPCLTRYQALCCLDALPPPSENCNATELPVWLRQRWVKGVVSTERSLCPVCPSERTLGVSVGMSQACP